jgi:hypothetical protein
MSIAFGAGAKTGSGNKDGIFLDEVVITRARAHYGTVPNNMLIPKDLGLEVSYKPVGKELTFEPSIFVSGNLKKDDLGRITAVGGAFKVSRLFEKAGVSFELDDQGHIPEEAMRDLIGRHIAVLTYRTDKSTPDKMKTRAWDMVEYPDAGDRLKEYFLQQVNGGWVKSYLANTATGEVAQAGYVVAGDADLPF